MLHLIETPDGPGYLLGREKDEPGKVRVQLIGSAPSPEHRVPGLSSEAKFGIYSEKELKK